MEQVGIPNLNNTTTTMQKWTTWWRNATQSRYDCIDAGQYSLVML